MQGFSIQPPDTGFGPSLLRFATAGEAALTRPDPKTPHLEAFARSHSVFELKGVRAFAKSVSIYIRRKQGWLRLEEEALLDLVLGFTEQEGLNIRIETDIKAGALVGETQWDIKSAEVKLNVRLRSIKEERR